MRALGQKHRRRVADFDQAAALHLEHADFVGRPEAVLGAAQQAVLIEALAFEIQHGVDHVLEDLRAGDGAVFGDVADQETGVPVDLANCRKRSAHSRNCETLPGSASTS